MKITSLIIATLLVMLSQSTPLQAGGSLKKGAKAISILSLLDESTELKLWEGLPHPRLEQALMLDELLEHETFEMLSHFFYKDPIELEKYEIHSLKRLMQNTENYEEIIFGRFCGSFHPDYYLEFKIGKIKYSAMICLGCGEVWIIQDKIVSKVYITNTGHKEFKRKFKPHYKNRPQYEN